MDQKIIDYLPAILLLVSVVTITLVVIAKKDLKMLTDKMDNQSILIFVAFLLFVFLLIVHLFKEQPWTADTLKVLIGVLIGAGSAKVSEGKKDADPKMNVSDNQITKSVFNQAMRDINQKIENFNSQVGKIEHAVIDQKNTTDKSKPKIIKRESLKLETDDQVFLNSLKAIQQNEDNWTWPWIEKSIKYQEIHDRLTNKIKELENAGWTILSMNFDNTGKGIHVNFELEKTFK